VLARGLDFVHSNIDILSESHPIDFGPDLPSSVESLQSVDLQQVLSSHKVELKITNAEISKPNQIPFAHECIESEKFVRFNELIPFDSAHTDSVFELSQLVRSLTEHGETALPNVGTDPVEYLRFAMEGRPLTCRYFAILLGATARTKGYTTRLISVTKHGRSREHAVCEIYVPQFSKWIVIDPDFNVAYQRQGKWLDARELHEAWQEFKQSLETSGQTLRELTDPPGEILLRTGVEVVELGPAGNRLRNTNMYGGNRTGINLELFEYVLYSIRNDYLSAEYPLGHPIRTREYVLQHSKDQGPPPVAPEAYVIEDVSQLYWPVGRSQIMIESCKPGSKPEVGLRLSTWTPNFDGFEVRIDRGKWTRHFDDHLQHKLRAGENRIEVRSVNLAGLRGEISELCIQLDCEE
jgi:hypothetical protein